MTQYLIYQRRLLKNDPRILVACTSTEPPDESRAIIDEFAQEKIAYVHPIMASFSRWDLIIFAHHGGQECFPKSVPKLLISHGFGGAKVVKGTDIWSRYWKAVMLDRFGRPNYSCVYESSIYRRNTALRACPELADTIVVVGDHRADELMRRSADRATIRADIGISPQERVVMISSTFGTDSLIETIGPKLFEVAHSLRGKYRFLVTTHPHQWIKEGNPAVQSLGDRLLALAESGFIVHRPPADTLDFLIAADVLVTDFGSMATNFAMLEKPIVFVPFCPGILPYGSTTKALCKICERLNFAEDLDGAVERACAHHSPAAMRRLKDEVVSYLHEASDRMTAELYRLLQLEQPTIDVSDKSFSTSKIGVS